MPKFVVVLPNIRSAWNIGAIFRTCDALGFEIILSGYTARPFGKNLEIIKKTSIGAEKTVPWQYFEHSVQVLANFPSNSNRRHLGIEINGESQNIYEFLQKEFGNLQNNPQANLANLVTKTEDNQEEIGNNNLENKIENGMEYFLWFGNEISGIESEILAQIDYILHLPMKGSKESLNIASCVCACGYLLDFATKII